MSVYRNNLIEQAKFLKRVASTVYAFGSWLKDNGLGQVIPLTPAVPVEGVCLQTIDSTNPNFALADQDLPVDGVAVTVDRFLVDITGTATEAMVGSNFNVDASDATKISVATLNTLTFDTLAVSTFAAGHTITGGTSSATAVITQVVGNTLIVGAITGTFRLGETITDGTSSATAALRSNVAGGTQFKLERFISASLGEFSVLPTAAV